MICINYTSSRMQPTRQRRCDSVAAAQLGPTNIYIVIFIPTCSIYTSNNNINTDNTY